MYSLFFSLYVALFTDRIATVNKKNRKIHLIFHWSFLKYTVPFIFASKINWKIQCVFYSQNIRFCNFNTVFFVFSLRMPVSHYIKKSDTLNPFSEEKNADYTFLKKNSLLHEFLCLDILLHFR